MTDKPVTQVSDCQGGCEEEVQTIGIGLEDRLLLVASRGDVIYDTGILSGRDMKQAYSREKRGYLQQKRSDPIASRYREEPIIKGPLRRSGPLVFRTVNAAY
jgi:hypothetical protein